MRAQTAVYNKAQLWQHAKDSLMRLRILVENQNWRIQLRLFQGVQQSRFYGG